MFYAVTDDGDRFECITKARALSLLLDLGKPGKIICENNIDSELPPSWTILVIHPDGRWEPMASPVETITYEE
jgi:hypothetical protein